MRMQFQSLALLSGLSIHVAMNCSVGHRHGLDLAVPVAVATAPIHPLAWETLYATGVALKRQKERKSKRKK